MISLPPEMVEFIDHIREEGRKAGFGGGGSLTRSRIVELALVVLYDQTVQENKDKAN